MRRFATLTRALLVMHLRDKETLFWNLAFPIGMLLLFGTIFTGDGGAAEVAAWFMAGIIVQNIMASGLSGDSAWLASARDRGILIRIRATPLPPAVLIGAYVAVRMLLVCVQSALIVAAAVLVFDARIDASAALPAAGLVLLGGIVFLLLGQVIAAAAPTASASNAVSNVVFFPLLFLSNLVIETTAFPAWLESSTRWNPAYMLVDLLRPALTAEAAAQAAWINLAGLALYGVLGLAVAARLFQWQPKAGA
jgi:ABC-2 type transport system permease protein